MWENYNPQALPLGIVDGTAILESSLAFVEKS